MEQRLTELYKSSDLYTVLEKFKGKSLKGKEYFPLFNYFSHLKTDKSSAIFTVLNNTFVTTDQGSGIVHQAPYFGEVNFYFFKINCVFSNKDNF